MNHDNNTQDLNTSIDNFTPEEVLKLSMNELKNPVASINGCIEILEKIVLPQLGPSANSTVERIIQILQANKDHIEKLRHDNYLYLEKRKEP